MGPFSFPSSTLSQLPSNKLNKKQSVAPFYTPSLHPSNDPDIQTYGVPSLTPTNLCNMEESSHVEDGWCHDDIPIYNSARHNIDGSNYAEIKAKYPNCPGPHSLLGNDIYESTFNKADYGFDIQDCHTSF